MRIKPIQRLLSLITLTFFLCTSFVGCGSSSVDPIEPTSNNDSSTSNNPEGFIVVDDELTVSFVGAEDASSLGVFYIFLNVENHTNNEIVINLESADVDGEAIPLITTGVPLVIRPGNSGQTGFIFSMVNLSISSMDEAEKATFKLVARDNSSYEIVYGSDLVTVNLH